MSEGTLLALFVNLLVLARPLPPPPPPPVPMDVDDARLGAVLAAPGACETAEGVGGGDWGESHGCHSQGLAWTREHLFTSCHDQERDVGLVQRFDGDLADHAPGGGGTAQVFPLGSGAHSHVVIGAPPGPDGDVFVPVVGSNSRQAAARVTLMDADGGVTCAFDHDATRRSDLHLGAVAAITVGAHLHLVACSWDCDYLFVYRLGLDGPDCTPTRVVELDRTGVPGWLAYNSLAVILAGGGVHYLLAGAGDHLDAWRVDGLGSPDMRLTQAAAGDWSGVTPVDWPHGLFREGMAIQPLSPTSLQILAAPHDYQQCDGDRICTRAVYRCPVEWPSSRAQPE
ncbi:MAG: hypothetical protein QGH45_03520 [Myxococcota bacterium]|jgi:hypothetical protein|nr:hypothetical protein [Myxococcota bacterium]